ncbi:MAG: karyopherin beta [Thelocarpon superellum]|nr:MAG: karyopherin beta [Thelocarpon superellum]
MNVTQVLESTLSPDAATRQNAEQQLSQAADVDFSGYVTTLAQELANEQAQTHIRSAAGIALKNAFSSREFPRLQEVQEKWLQHVDPQVKKSVKDLALRTLSAGDAKAAQSAAQFIASIAAIEIPREQWPELMPALVHNVGDGADHLKQASLVTIGYICETEDTDLRDSLGQHSNAILTAVVQGARKEEANIEVRLAAVSALGDSLEFVRTNFENEGERNYIMQVICEATQSDDNRIQEGAFGCLNRIMALYYDKMRFYMEKALFGLTIMGMKSEQEDVAKLAVEFWCTVCEEEIAIEDDNAQAAAESAGEMRPYFNFARVATLEVVPVLLLLLAKQDEDAADDDYNVARAAYQCLQLYAQAVGSAVIPPVLAFVEQNLRHEDWHNRDAAVSAFGAVMEGPDDKMLDPLVKQALPVLIGMMDDKVVQVKDSAAYALGRICESVPDSIDAHTHLPHLISSLFTGLSTNPKMAASCCWALMNLADRFAGEPGTAQNPLSKHFQDSVTHVLQLTEQNDTDNQLRTAAYEVLNAFVANAAIDSLPIVAKLSDVILQRLENTIPMQSQVVGVEDRITLEEMQTSLTSVLLSIIQRLEGEIQPQADRIMHVLLALLQSVGPKSSVPDTVFAAVGGLANALDEAFAKYMESFAPPLYSALGNQDEPALCSMAIGLVSDIVRALGELSQPYCDTIMNYLLNNLRSTTLSNQFKPAILQCFGDIAQSISGHFETYLSVVSQVLQQAATVTASPIGTYEMLEYVVSLREGIMDAWGGIVLAMKASGKSKQSARSVTRAPDLASLTLGRVAAELLRPYVEAIFQFLNSVWLDTNRSESLLRSSLGVIGDLADAFPNGDYANFYRADWISHMIKEARTNRDAQPRTIDTARTTSVILSDSTRGPVVDMMASYRIQLRGSKSEVDKYPAKQHAGSVARYLGASRGLVYLRGDWISNYRDSDRPRPFRQRRYFFYMTGVDEPGCHLTYDLRTQHLQLYIPPVTPDTVIWNGPMLSLDEARRRYDVDDVSPVQCLRNDVQAWLHHNREASLYVLHPDQSPPMFEFGGRGTALASQRVDSKQLQAAMDKARVRKSPHEIQLIRRANEITAAAHRAVLGAVGRMKNEMEIQAAFVDACISRGAKHQAYEVIAASGENASTLHYVKNDEPLRGRRLVCLDAGCEWNCYASDVTRTFPLRGWSTEAKAIYTIVDEMQRSCVERVKPGVRLLDLHVMAHKIAIAGLLRLGLLHNGTAEEILEARTSMFFYPHGLSHHLGLECHDVYTSELLGRKEVEQCPVGPTSDQHSPLAWDPQVLEESMVITVEPGIYFSRYAYEHVYAQSSTHTKYINRDVLEQYWAVGGVRIEDDILVTHDGYENLTTAPKGSEMTDLIEEGRDCSQKVGQRAGQGTGGSGSFIVDG